jgi:subtilisin
MFMKRITNRIAGVLLTALLIGCRSEVADVPAGPGPDCLVQASVSNGQTLAGQYIVTVDLAQSLQNLPTLPNARQAAPAAREQLAAETFLRSHWVDDPTVEMITGSDNEASFVAHLEPMEASLLWNDPAVRLIEPDRLVSYCTCINLEAPGTLTWNVRQTGYGRGDIQNTRTAWVIDTGIDLDHPDLNVDVARSRSFLTGTANTPDDNNGHGTHVAGIIGARNNSIGITGVASGARLVSLKVLNQLGEGRLSGIISAVNHVNQNGQLGDVVNLSLGAEANSPTLERAIRQGAERGVLFAVAAGNDGTSAEEQTPARINHPNIFTVTAIDQAGQIARFSNYGPSVDVAAYGVRITSTYRDGRYATLSGTSMAAPHVAGLLYIRGSRLPTRGQVVDSRDGRTLAVAGE